MIAQVLKSKNPLFKKKDLVISYLPWIVYQINDGANVKNLPIDVPPTYFLGGLGTAGIAAYLPLFKIGLIAQGQTIFISGAAGAIG